MSDENELSVTGQVIAGIMLILFTTLAVVLLIGFWPDRMPEDRDKCQLYSDTLFAVRLIDTCCKQQIVPLAARPNARTRDDHSPDLLQIPRDTAAGDTATKTFLEETICNCNLPGTITLNKLLLLLVCLGGFLGGMVYISTSFTAYVGSRQFRRSWKLWYFVKPFTAVGIAVALYFTFRAGLLTHNNDASNINLYGIMTLALLSGLFSQIAAQKLKEVFQAAFNPKGDLPDKIDETKPEIITIESDTLDRAKENIITIKGRNLDKSPLTIKVNDAEVKDVVVTNNTITIKYTIPPDQRTVATFKLDILDKSGNVIKSFELK
jgi:hypothetical protein